MRIKNITIFVLVMIALAVFSSGCTSKSEITNTPATTSAVPTVVPTITPAPTPETPKTAQLKIMSVTTGPATLGGIPLTIKVKNIGNATAKDVYAGIINIQHSPPSSWDIDMQYSPQLSFDNYPQKMALINQSVHDVLINGSSSANIDFTYTSMLFDWNKIPGTHNEKLRKALAKNFGIDWVNAGKIEKIDGGKTIIVTTGTNNLSLSLDDEMTSAKIKIDDGRTDEFTLLDKNGELGVYYTTNTRRFGGLIVTGTLGTKDYLGDILPDETKTAQITAEILDKDTTYLKVAWMDNTKEFTLY
jgi:hypothetical protein